MKRVVLFLLLVTGLYGQQTTKLKAESPTMDAPTSIQIPEISSLKLINARQDSAIKQYQIGEYWKAIQQLQEAVKKDADIIQSMTKKIYVDAKVSQGDYKISDDGTKLEKTSSSKPLSAEVKDPMGKKVN